MATPLQKPIRRFGEGAYILGLVISALGVCLSAKSGTGVSAVVSPAYVLSAYLEPIAPFFSLGNTQYIVQGLIVIVLAIFVKRITISYPLSFLTGFFYGLLIDMWRLVFGASPVDDIGLKIFYTIVGALVTEIGIALILRTYLPQTVYNFAVREISVVKKLNINKVKLIYDISSIIVAIILMLIFFGKFVFSLIGIGTLVLAVVNPTLIALFGKLFDKIIDFSPLFEKFAHMFFKVNIKE